MIANGDLQVVQNLVFMTAIFIAWLLLFQNFVLDLDIREMDII